MFLGVSLHQYCYGTARSIDGVGTSYHLATASYAVFTCVLTWLLPLKNLE